MSVDEYHVNKWRNSLMKTQSKVDKSNNMEKSGPSRKVLVLNGSPTGENSITLQTVLFIANAFSNTEFSYLHVGKRIKAYEKDFAECRTALEKADLILFCYPVYTFLVPSQLHRFIELIKENNVDLHGKYATQISTSKHFYDVTAHQFIQDNCNDLGMRSIRGLSADMEDLLSEKGRKEAIDFFRFVEWSMDNQAYEPDRDIKRAGAELAETTVPSGKELPENYAHKVALVTDLADHENSRLQKMIDRFRAKFNGEVVLVNLHDFNFFGGCQGCFHCASDGTCIYKDGFQELLRNQIQTTEATVYAYTVKDHSMGYRFKLFDDRQFCNGHRTVTMGKPVGYLVDGMLSAEPNLTMLMESRAQVGGNYLAGIACNEKEPDREIDQLALTLEYAIENHYQPPKNFYGVGGLKIFRDLIYQMQGLMREDHRFYKEHGFYDFPQKRKAMILGMYLVGSMMNSKKLSKKLGAKMTEGMLMPYQQVIKKTKKKHGKA